MKYRYQGLFIVAIAAAAFLFPSCKEHTLIDANAIPNVGNINTVDFTWPIYATMYQDDSVVTSHNISGVPILQGVGIINSDPFFGKTYASTFFQIVPGSISLDLSTATIDSSVLCLPYGNFRWGDTVHDFTYYFKVNELADSLSSYTDYYAGSNVAVGTELGRVAVNVNTLQIPRTIITGTDTAILGGELHIPLNDVFKTEVVDNYKALSASSSTFLAAFKGVCISPINAPSLCLPYFQLDGVGDGSAGQTARIDIYYHDAAGAAHIENVYFSKTLPCAHFNRIQHDQTSTPIAAVMTANAQDGVFGIQNQPGISIDIKLGNLKNFPAGVLNKAELDFPALPVSSAYRDNVLTRPYLFIPYTVAGNINNTILDGFPIGNNSVDGTSHPLTIGGVSDTVYTMNIIRELQAALTRGDDSLHLHICGSLDYFGAYRLRTGGPAYGGTSSDSLYRMKLNIVYSKPIQ